MTINEEKKLERLQAERNAADLALTAARLEVSKAQKKLYAARRDFKRALDALVKYRDEHTPS